MDKHGQTCEAIRSALLKRTGAAPDARTIAEATLSTWHQVSVRLTPVIGVRGVEALFSRSLYLTALTFPWLVLAGEQEDNTVLLAIFRARLESQEPAVVTEASYVLLVTFTELLETLIGESLTDRLVGPVWASPSLASKPETSL